MRILLLALLIACNGSDGPTPVGIGQAVVEMCGDPPLAPAFTAAFDADAVTMTRTTYDGITAWRDAVAVWRECVVDLP